MSLLSYYNFFATSYCEQLYHLCSWFHRDLSDNDFDYLPIPKSGWPELRYLYLNNVPSLHQAPGPNDCPKLQWAEFTYANHCCAFESFLPPDWHEASSLYVGPTLIIPVPINITDDSEVTPPSDISPIDTTAVCEFYKLLNISIMCPAAEETTEPSFEPPQINITEVKIVHHSDNATTPRTNYFVHHSDNATTPRTNYFVCYPKADLMATCYPKADPMASFDHLLGSWTLRVLIWAVFLLILFGNGLVLIMIVAGLKPFQRCGLATVTDSKVSKLYISQLAVADIGICIYLGFLIAMDLKTLDKQELYQTALSWQYGSGCSTAGFIAILSLELSVYMLVVIILEQIYSRTHTGIATKMHMYRATLIILFGWIFAGICATLPLLDINSYSTVVICLPFDVISAKGRFYIATLMGINLLAFTIVLICSSYLCCRLGKTTIDNSKIFCVMSVLTLIIFICWAPLIIFSYVALSKNAPIDISTAKWFALLVLPISACINPFQYAPLTEKFICYMQKVCYCVKRILPQCCTKGNIPQQNSIVLDECDRQTTLEQNSPSVMSANVPLLDRHASLPELNSDGSLPPISLSNSMPELAISGELMIKTKATQSTIKVQATDKQLETKNDMDGKEESKNSNEGAAIIPDKVVSSKIHHNTYESSGIDSPRINMSTAYSVQGIEEDLQSITSLSEIAANTFNDDPNMANALSSKLNSPALVEETDV